MSEHPDILTNAEWELMFMAPDWTPEVEEALGRSTREAFNLHLKNMDARAGFDRAAFHAEMRAATRGTEH